MYPKKEISSKDALIKAQKLCARQEKCKSDIRKKLYDWKVPAETIESIINKLVDEKFIDEKRYAEYFVRDKFRFNKWGRIKIAYALKQKQIHQSIIDSALKEINDKEYRETLKNELQKKRKTLKDSETFKIKEKLLRFAQSKGYEPEIIFDLIDKVIE